MENLTVGKNISIVNAKNGDEETYVSIIEDVIAENTFFSITTDF